MDALINAWSETRSVDEVLKGLESKGIPCAPVRGIPEVLKDKNFLDSGAIVPVVHPIHGEIPSVKAAGLPIRFSESVAGFDKPAPTVGQNNEEIYGAWLGLDKDALAKLKAEGII